MDFGHIVGYFRNIHVTKRQHPIRNMDIFEITNNKIKINLIISFYNLITISTTFYLYGE